MRHVIEESLANAIALRQNYRFSEQKFLEKFVSGQSRPYRAGLKWARPLADLLEIADNWLDWKETLTQNSEKYDFKTDCSSGPCLIHRLLSQVKLPNRKPISVKSFEDEFRMHATQ